ncbi:peptide chain release factor 2 [Candidatus Microgenomates bacterium]|nr:peptide chain release factor 2 [Candidatus Microgenomates bacterium]
MQDLVKQTVSLLEAITAAMVKLDIGGKRQQLAELNAQMASPDFWKDNERAKAASQGQSRLQNQIEDWEKLAKEANDLQELARSGDADLSHELSEQYQVLRKRFETKEFELKLSGKFDHNGAILAVHAGTGGTDAMDWAQMLQRLYMRWAERRGFQVRLVDQTVGDEAGIKSATLHIGGPLAYGYLRGEHGVHRLVRKSPFNADHLRQTSFALVEVLPELDKPDEIPLDPKDLRVDVFRSQGAGGQSVNTTDSAVRLTHLPTGITVSVQNERSQLQNRETAMKILQGRLAKLAHEQHVAELAKLKGPNIKAKWGQQIRNYVLDPYQLVKDVRSGFETSDVNSVLDGQIDGFVEAYLASQVGEAGR